MRNNARNFINEKNIEIDKILDLVDGSNNIVILTHKNPDGDAIGSAYAMLEYCKSKGKNVSAFVPYSFPSNMEFINYGNRIKSFDEKQDKDKILNADLIIIVDLNSSERIAYIAKYVRESKAKKLLIDHHIDPENFCDYYFVNSDSASTGQLIYAIIKSENNYEISKRTAQAIYTAIMTDTGSFRFPKTDANVHRIVKNLLEAGADPVEAYDKVYNSFPISALKLRGRVYEKIETFKNDTVCFSQISEAEFKELNSKEEETEGIVESLLAVKSVKIAILLIESAERGEIRCSFRAKANFNVSEMARFFGGGGHTQAAGARVINKSLTDVRSEIINYIEKNSFEVN